jgi:hypothetical protein
MPNVHTSYDIPIKNPQGNANQTNLVTSVLTFLFAACIAASIAASGCRFSLPFCRTSQGVE